MKHALDYFCHSFDHVGTGVGNLVHDGWIHPHRIGHRHGGASDQSHSGTKSLVAISAWIVLVVVGAKKS